MPLVIFQLKIKMEKKTSNNIPKRIPMEQIMPEDDTGTGSPKTIVYKNHGKGSLSKASNEYVSSMYVVIDLPNSDVKDIGSN